MKTNAARILTAWGIPYDLIEYQTDEDRLDAVSVADAIGAERESVFKTLVARGDRTGICVFVIPGPSELDAKKAAAVSGNKSIALVSVRDLFPLTGYVRGGCSPIGMRKRYPTWIDETAQAFDAVFVSAGIRGLQMRIDPHDLCRAVEGTWADLV
ncbi:MAG: Cys-tRNA(Pro) deacylase [Bacteroidota bacterium]|nr:Cys-tRNA(Pro) deacylase [Bacteroidota bacterium]